MRFMDKYKKAAPTPVAAPSPTPAPAAVPTPAPVKAVKAAPAPKVVEVEPETVVVTDVPEEDAGTNFALSLLGGGDEESTNVLAALVTTVSSGGVFSPGGAFPFVGQTKGNSESAGGLCAANGTPEEVAELLPQGKGAFTGVFFAHRLIGVLWPEAGQSEDGEKAKPIGKVIVASNDAQLSALARKAAEVYQFTKGHDKNNPAKQPSTKDKFDGIGHFRLGVEILVFRKGIPFVIATPVNYSSVEKTLSSLAAAFPNGKYAAFPAKITPVSESAKGSTAWVTHSLKFSVALDDKGKEVFTEFRAFAAEAGNDPEFQAAFAEWKRTDVNDDVIERLTKIASMGR